MAKDQMVDVLIQGSMEVRYSQIVSMSKEEFDRLDFALGDDCPESACEQVQDYLDLHDVDDAEILEVDTFEIVNVAKRRGNNNNKRT